MRVLALGGRRGLNRPLLLTAKPWRATAYVALRMPLPALAMAAVAGPPLAGAWGVSLTVGLPLFVAYLAVSVVAAPADRRAVALLGQPVVPDPHREPERRTPIALLRLRAREPATGRELLNGLLSAILVPLDVAVLFGWGLGTLVLLLAPLLVGHDTVAAGPWTIRTSEEAWLGAGIGLALLVAGAYVVTVLAALHAAHVRALLGPRGDELRMQVSELTRSRLRLIDAFDVERRRIERDLHDGAQQQLVALAMTLDQARIELEGSDGEAARLVERAQAQSRQTIADLRSLINAIHPPILSDRGLAAALPDLVDRSPLRVRTTVDVPRRLPAAIETTAWFVLSEALANAAKHSRADAVELDVRLAGSTLRLQARDDGVGGADPGRGSGLAGLADRVAAVGGRLTLTSPRGGPTVVRAELPCAEIA